jgi:hypothetical protein
MKSRTQIVTFVILLVAVESGAAAFADCPTQIVIGTGPKGQELAYFNRATIHSANIPTEPGVKYECVFESHNGMVPQDHALSANEFIKSIGTGWQKSGDTYTCGEGRDCAFVIQKD